MDRVSMWKPQVSFNLVVNGHLICRYVVDFEVTKADGSIELIEVKGFETPEFKLKRKLFEATWLAEHPDVTYSVIK